jgi:hypothetical protein
MIVEMKFYILILLLIVEFVLISGCMFEWTSEVVHTQGQIPASVIA